MAKEERLGTKRYRRERNKLKVKPPSKIVIRHLPPTMTEEEFLQQIDPLPEHDFFYFSAADWSLGFDATCRAYITFKKYEDVFMFRDRFDGYVFADNKGNEYAAIVEFAPFQGFVKNKYRNSDNKVDTIEQVPHYEQFLKKLEEAREAASKGGESKLEFTLDSKKEKITSTPLLQYLARKKEKRREENKKRTAEKKKRQEDEKDKRKQNQTPTLVQPVKILKAVKNSSKSEQLDQKAAQARDELQNASSRRREVRNRMRHEAFLQKKKALKEQHANNKEGKCFFSEKDSNGQIKKGNIKVLKKSGNEDEATDRNSQFSDSQKPIEILRKSKPAGMLPKCVRNFIFSAVSSPTVPAASGDNASSCDTKDNPNDEMKDLQDNMSKLAISNDETMEVEKDVNEAKLTERQRIEKEREKRRAERRIRNKDRPSIAIYTPKPRLRASDESDCNSMSTKDILSLSISDCENVAKKDEQPRQKKVQRYSEWSKNRRKSLPKEGGCDAIFQGHITPRN